MAGMARYGKLWLGTVRHGWMRRGLAWQARRGVDWQGAEGRGESRYGRHGLAGRGRARQGAARHGRHGGEIMNMERGPPETDCSP